MKKIHVAPLAGCRAKVRVQGDKSISHRAIIIGSLAKGTARIRNFLEAEDTLNTAKIYRELGVRIEKKGGAWLTHGRGLFSLREPAKTLYAGNSGTSIRLNLGVLAAQNFTSTITGDAQIAKRPMKRVILPLTEMGARFESNNGMAPVVVHGGQLRGISYKMPMASAQVKSAVMLAALHADSPTVIIEGARSRDHTEKMLAHFGADVSVKGNRITIKPGRELSAAEVFVPGDISSAAYFAVAGVIMKGSKITVKDVGLNPTRTGLISALRKMGAKIKVTNLRKKNNEPVGDIVASSSRLKGGVIRGALIPKLIDEIPVIAVAAAQARGRTVIRDAKELRVKETDRIATVAANLRRLGIRVEEKEDGMIIHGNAGAPFRYADIDSFGDHRIAMAFSVAALASENGMLIKDVECVNTSFPEFFNIINSLKRKKK
jgi:3-phosphoshikimate 1-carboxyvinyltransferase